MFTTCVELEAELEAEVSAADTGGAAAAPGGMVEEEEVREPQAQGEDDQAGLAAENSEGKSEVVSTSAVHPRYVIGQARLIWSGQENRVKNSSSVSFKQRFLACGTRKVFS